MAFNGNKAWYVSTAAWTAVTAWATGTAKNVGDIVRQLAAPAAASERIFVCIVAGTTHATTEPTWTLTRGAKITDNTVTWQEATGVAALNGDLTNTPTWTVGAKNTAITLGHVIKSDNGQTTLICTTAGTSGNGAEPTWGAVGATTADNTVTWTTLKTGGAKFANWAGPSAGMLHITAATWGDADGQIYYLGSDHAEVKTTSGGQMTSRGTTASPAQILSVNRAGSMPPVAADLQAGAVLENTGNSNMDINGWWGRVYGVTFKVGTTNGNIRPTATGDKYFDNCTFWLNTSAASASFFWSNVANVGRWRFKSCKFRFGNASQRINNSGSCLTEYIDCSIDGAGTAPSAVFAGGGNGSMTHCTGCDWSLATTNLTNIGSGVNHGESWLFEGCKVNASLTDLFSFTGSTAEGVVYAYAERCDNGVKNWQQHLKTFTGQMDAVSNVQRANGAQAPDAQHFSWKVVTNVNANYGPGRINTPRMLSYNAVTAANIVVTLFGIANTPAMPTDIECFITIDYPGSASSNLFTHYSSFGDTISGGAALTADTSVWSDGATARVNSTAYALGDVISVGSNPNRIFFCTTAGTSANPEPAGYASAVDGGSVTDGTAVFRAGWRFKITKTLSTPQPQLVGNIIVQAGIGKASSTIYIDPQPTVA